MAFTGAQSTNEVNAAANLQLQLLAQAYVPASTYDEKIGAYDAIAWALQAFPKSLSASVTPVAIAGNESAEQTLAPTAWASLVAGDRVLLTRPAAETAGTMIGGARVSTAGTLAITVGNFTSGSLTPAAGTYVVTVFRN